MNARRDSEAATELLAQAQAERELITADRRKGGAYEIATARDPEFRSMPDQPLPDRFYAEAKRVAQVLGQDAATAMLQAEMHKRMMARIDREHARQRARRGVTVGMRLGSLCGHAVAFGLAAVAVHYALLATGTPPGMVVSFSIFTGLSAITASLFFALAL